MENIFQLAQQHDLAFDTQQLERTLSRFELSFVLGRGQGRILPYAAVCRLHPRGCTRDEISQ